MCSKKVDRKRGGFIAEARKAGEIQKEPLQV